MGQTREVEFEHGRPVVEGAPEIAVHQVLDERPVLDPEGLVEPEVLAKRLDVAAAGTRLHQENGGVAGQRSEEHTSELQSRENLVCRLLLEKKKKDKGQRNLLRTCR